MCWFVMARAEFFELKVKKKYSRMCFMCLSFCFAIPSWCSFCSTSIHVSCFGVGPPVSSV